MENKKASRATMKLLGLGILGFIVLTFLIMSAAYILAPSLICNSKECFVSKANTCAYSRFTDANSAGQFEYQTNNCILTKTLVKTDANEIPEVKELVEGKSMSCKYEQGKFDDRWISELATGIESCEGELKDAIGMLYLFS